MERSKEISLLNSALQSQNTQVKVNDICRRIIKERINGLDLYDSNLRDKVMAIISCLHFPLKERLVERSIESSQNNGIGLSSLAVCILFAIIGFILTFIPLWSILGGSILIIVAGFGVFSSFTTQQPSSSSATLVCASTASELIAEIDSVYAKLLDIVNHNQLEGRHKDVLVWLQRVYSDNEDKKLATELLKLMAILGYEFVKYSDDECENFEVSNANVAEIVTTKFAVRNKATGTIILPGVVVFPKEGRV